MKNEIIEKVQQYGYGAPCPNCGTENELYSPFRLRHIEFECTGCKSLYFLNIDLDDSTGGTNGEEEKK